MRIINIVLVSLMLSACASSVNIDYDKDANFKKFKTYNIEKTPVRVSVDTRIDSPFMQERVAKELDAVLTKKGFKYLKGNAELTVKYYLDIRREVETDGSSVSVGFGTSSRSSAVGMGFMVPVGETNSIDKLVLTIDVISSKTDTLIWRGSLGYTLVDGATPETYSRLIKDLVSEILENFPPK
jgi:hypothetical protein